MHSVACALLLAPLLHHDETPATAPQAPERFTTSRTSAIDLPLPEEKDAFVFCVYGDRTGGPAEGIEILAKAVEETNLIAPDLVMTVGDLVQGYNDETRWLPQMEEFKRTMNALGSPWFPVAGNHDVYWRGKGERPNGGNGALFEAHFAPLWYAFEHKRSWFIALYSDEGDPATGEQSFDKPNCQRMSDAQFAWLGSTLARAKDAEHVFLFLHHPRWLAQYGEPGAARADDLGRALYLDAQSIRLEEIPTAERTAATVAGPVGPAEVGRSSPPPGPRRGTGSAGWTDAPGSIPTDAPPEPSARTSPPTPSAMWCARHRGRSLG